MKLHNSMANRNIVQIFNEREDRLVTTILALPHYRMQPTDKTEFRFWEVPAGEARALRAWFYPGDHHGQEFVYPKGFAVQIAKQNHMNVPILHDEAKTSVELAKVEVDSLNEAGVQEPLALSAYEKLELPANPVEVALATPPIEAVAETAAETHSSVAGHESLPETSSPAAAVGLAGLLSLAAGAGLRALSRRSA
jgi:hypothetical protein